MNIKDTMSKWASAPPAAPVVPLSIQGVLAVLFTVVGLASTAAFLTTSNKKTSSALISALVASVAAGFGAVYIVNAVHVYTG